MDLIYKVNENQIIKYYVNFKQWKRQVFFMAYHISKGQCLTFIIDTSLQKKLAHKQLRYKMSTLLY